MMSVLLSNNDVSSEMGWDFFFESTHILEHEN